MGNGMMVLSNLGQASTFSSENKILEQMLRRQQLQSAMGGFRRGGGNQSNQLTDFIAQLQASSEKANEANEARFAEGKALLNNLGVAGKADIDRQATQAAATSQQELTSRGLAGTTIGQGNKNQIQANAALNKQKIDESVAEKKVGFIERREDTGPDLALIAQLIQQNAATQQQGGGRRFPGQSRFF